MWRPRKAIVTLGIASVMFSVTAQSEEPVGAVNVTGPEKRLHEFHGTLLSTLSVLLGNDDQSNFFVVCDILGRSESDSECSNLSKTKEQQAKIHYTYRRDHARLEAFVLSWNAVQNHELDSDVKITFDMSIAPQNCATALKPICVFNPVCPGPPRRCEKTAGPPCEPC
jgi:hypothetical protein